MLSPSDTEFNFNTVIGFFTLFETLIVVLFSSKAGLPVELEFAATAANALLKIDATVRLSFFFSISCCFIYQSYLLFIMLTK